MNIREPKFIQKKWLRLMRILALALIALVHGCGYSLRATGEPLGIRIDSIAIPLIQSTSSDLGFEADVARIIREEFISRANVPIMPLEKAQTVLTARVYDIRTEGLSFDIGQRNVNGREITHSVTNSRRLRMKLEAKFMEKKSGKVIWHEVGMEEQATFRVDSDPIRTGYNQRLAVREIAERLAKRVFLKTMERF